MCTIFLLTKKVGLGQVNCWEEMLYKGTNSPSPPACGGGGADDTAPAAPAAAVAAADAFGLGLKEKPRLTYAVLIRCEVCYKIIK